MNKDSTAHRKEKKMTYFVIAAKWDDIKCEQVQYIAGQNI